MSHLAHATQLVECPATFAEFYRAKRPTVFRTALKVVRRVQDAEEIANDAFLRFLRSVRKGSYRGECSVETYLHIIATRAGQNRLKHNWVKRHFGTESFDNELSDAGSLHEQLEATDYGPRENLDLSELDYVFKCSAMKLNPQHQQVMYLRAILDLPYEQIAQQLGTEEGTVKSMLARAREALRRKSVHITHDETYWQT